MRSEVARSGKALEVWSRTVTGDELILNAEIYAVDHAAVDVRSERGVIHRELTRDLQPVRNRRDRHRLRRERQRRFRLNQALGRFRRCVGEHVFTNPVNRVRARRNRGQQVFNREDTESALNDTRLAVAERIADSVGNRVLDFNVCTAFTAVFHKRVVCDVFYELFADGFNFFALVVGCGGFLLQLQQTISEGALFDAEVVNRGFGVG